MRRVPWVCSVRACLRPVRTSRVHCCRMRAKAAVRAVAREERKRAQQAKARPAKTGAKRGMPIVRSDGLTFKRKRE